MNSCCELLSNPQTFVCEKNAQKMLLQIVNVCMYMCLFVCVCVCVRYSCILEGGNGETFIFLNFEKLQQRLLHQSPNPLQLSTKSSSSKTAVKLQ